MKHPASLLQLLKNEPQKEPLPESSNFLNDVRISSSKRGWNWAVSIQPRISLPASASARTSSMFRFSKRFWMRSVKLLCSKKSRNASEVVANPVGTRTPVEDNWEIIFTQWGIFLPPTDSTSVIRSCSKGKT